ncbi:MAG: hypothetical protein HZB59_10120 [Ignavibacteriales bacterium]|nr:hypothetical protein [Ignavibacteriales bacterium]
MKQKIISILFLLLELSSAGYAQSSAIISAVDSLDMKLLEIEISKADLQVRQTNFWHRIVPQIHVSASLGMKDIIFVNPTNFVPYILPKDAYRLSISISINEILDFDKHTNVELELEQLHTRYNRLKKQQSNERSILILQSIELDSLCAMAKDELKLKEDILKFKTLCFQQGKIEFDEFLKSQLDLLSVRKSLIGINKQRKELSWILYGGNIK